MAVNGEVFYDGLGEFTAVREYLLSGYPEALRRKADCRPVHDAGSDRAV